MTRDALAEPLPLPTPGPLLLPLAGSLLFTGVLAALFCTPPAAGHRLPLTDLLGLAALYLLMAAVAHAGAVWLVHRLFDGLLPLPARLVITGLWTTVAWLPLLSLLTAERSFWVAATLPLIATFALLYLKRWQPEPEPAAPAQRALLEPPAAIPFWRPLLPSALAACAVEAGIASIASRHAWLAGLCFTAALAVPVWTLVRSRRSTGIDERPRRGALLRDSLAAWALTALALLPFMSSSSPLAEAIAGLIAGSHAAASIPVAPRIASGAGPLEFIVLLQPAVPHPHRVEVPVAPSRTTAPAVSEPHVIPFDGPYWYFKHYGETPGPRDRVEHGDPRRIHVRSTDYRPMLMEARQPMSPPLSVACCGTLQLALTNADGRPETIAAEVLLWNAAGPGAGAISLGEVKLPSSQSPHAADRPPVDETLSFAIPPAARAGSFRSITVRLRTIGGGGRSAPLVAIHSFTLAR